MASCKEKLTIHDQQILESIFNPNQPFTDHDDANILPEAADKTGEPEIIEDQEWKRLESEAVGLAESQEFTKALALFNQAVELQPEKAASYNNRAQLHRLMGNIEDAKRDLDMAIAKNGGFGSAACQAYTQRAMIRRLEGDDDGCRADFKLAADLGSKFAKQQLVALNPYAALCNSMLSEMMCKIKRGEPENSGDPAA